MCDACPISALVLLPADELFCLNNHLHLSWFLGDEEDALTEQVLHPQFHPAVLEFIRQIR
jgi:hypothetical protein